MIILIVNMTQETSNDLKKPQKIELLKPDPNADSAVNRTTNMKSKLKCGSMHEIGEIKDDYLDETLHKINL